MKATKLTQFDNQLIEVSLKNGTYFKGIMKNLDINDGTFSLKTLSNEILITTDSISAIKQKVMENSSTQ